MLRQLGDVDRLAQRLGLLVQPREREQVLDEHAHALGLVLDAAHHHVGAAVLVGGADAEELRVAADRGQRRAQLVRGVGEELAQALLARLALGERLLEPVEHRVQREPEPADLRSRRGRAHPPRELAGGDLAGGDLHAVERAQPEANDEERAHAQGEQHAGDHERPRRASRWFSVWSTSCSGTAATVMPLSSGSCARIRAVAQAAGSDGADREHLADRHLRGKRGRGGRRLAIRDEHVRRAPCRRRRGARRRCPGAGAGPARRPGPPPGRPPPPPRPPSAPGSGPLPSELSAESSATLSGGRGTAHFLVEAPVEERALIGVGDGGEHDQPGRREEQDARDQT